MEEDHVDQYGQQPEHHDDHQDGIKEEDIDEVVHLGERDGDEPMDEDDDDNYEDIDESESRDQVGRIEHGSSSLPHQGATGQAEGEADGVETFEDTSIAAFYEHRKSVFTVALHPNYPHPPLALTGGEDDNGYLWHTHEGEPIVKLSGHTDSVVSAGFNFSGDMVATGGMDGFVRVWRRRGEADQWSTWEFLASLEGPDEIVWIDWHPRGNVIAAGGSDSTVWMWTLPLGKAMQVFSGHTAAVTTGTFTPDGKKLVTASEDGSLIVWDPRSPSPVAKLQSTDSRFRLNGGITKIRISPDSRTVIVGGGAGELRVVSIAKVDEEGSIGVVSVLDGHARGESVEAIEFIDLFGQAQSVTNIVTGATDGKGFVWDISNGKMRNAITHEAAITSIVVHPGTTLFSTSSADHSIKTWDARTGACLGVQRGFTDGVLALAVGKDDGFTQGAETGGIGAYVDPTAGKGWKLVGAGDEGVALVFRV